MDAGFPPPLCSSSWCTEGPVPCDHDAQHAHVRRVTCSQGRVLSMQAGQPLSKAMNGEGRSRAEVHARCARGQRALRQPRPRCTCNGTPNESVCSQASAGGLTWAPSSSNTANPTMPKGQIGFKSASGRQTWLDKGPASIDGVQRGMSRGDKGGRVAGWESKGPLRRPEQHMADAIGPQRPKSLYPRR